MTKPLNQLVVEAFQKLRDWVSSHSFFLSILDEGLGDMGVVKRTIAEEQINHYLKDEISCTEVLELVEKALTKGHLVIINSTNGIETVTLKQGDREILLERGIKEEEVTRLQNFAQYFYKLYLISNQSQ
jgi:hypothetical protein